MDQTRREFLIEFEELVERLFADLDQLRTSVAGNPSPRQVRSSIDQLFRSVHSIKGTAAAGGFDSVTPIAHELENLLDALRTGNADFAPDLIDIFAAAADALGESPGLSPGDVNPSQLAILQRLRTATKSNVGNSIARPQSIVESALPQHWRSLSSPEKHLLESSMQEGASLFEIETSFEMANFDQQFNSLKEQLTEHGEVVATAPTVDEANPERIQFRILYASDESLEELKAAMFESSLVKIAPIAHPPPGSGESDEVSTPVPSEAALLSTFVRADLEKLDRLISSTDEVFLATSRALDLALMGPDNWAENRAELHDLNAQIRKRFLGVESDLIELRMVPLASILQRAARAGRAAARLVGKEIDFEITGGELRVDKLIADAVADPLLHLVRNAVDHGIEDVGARVEAGKSSRGRITIRAISEGSQTRIRIMDDGRGIDPIEIADAAKRLGLAPALARDSERIDIDRSLRLIFRPGFTTLETASQVSGRGVGLDIVETAIEQVGGELRVSTEPTLGTTFEIRLPVTFGLIAANVVVSAGVRYCIPADQTLGIDAIDVIDGSSGANQLRQVSMRDLLGQPNEAEDSANPLQLITCQFTDERAGRAPESTCVGIVVDRVEGPQEVLVRNLGRHAGRWYGIAGATELRDGTVALVLDLPRLLSPSVAR